ncbi:MAG: hypothetical protein AMXMBFR56_80390 [Polyangiaceae bacterium]
MQLGCWAEPEREREREREQEQEREREREREREHRADAGTAACSALGSCPRLVEDHAARVGRPGCVVFEPFIG